MALKIYHNPRCKKSRETLKLLEDNGQQPEIVEYLKTPLSSDELTDLVKRLDMDAYDLVRREEKLYKENYKGKELENDEWIQVLAENPKLMQRPVVDDGQRAVIGRPPENVMELLK